MFHTTLTKVVGDFVGCNYKNSFRKIVNDSTHLSPMHPFSTLWKQQEIERFSDVFRGYRKGAVETNGLIDAWQRSTCTSDSDLLFLCPIWTCICFVIQVPSKQIYMLKVEIETLEEGAKYVQS